jgi:hypothetical protein
MDSDTSIFPDRLMDSPRSVELVAISLRRVAQQNDSLIFKIETLPNVFNVPAALDFGFRVFK